MNLGTIAWRSIQQRSLSSALTALSMALGVALVVAVLVIYGTVRNSFQQSAQGYDLIVGAKGGKLQLVLNTVYHLSQPIENIPWSFYREFHGGQFTSSVSAAIPFCLGDNYQGFRVVGTVPGIFEGYEYAPGRSYTFSSGRNFAADEYFEAVVGSLVARRTGLKVGDSFQPTHGIDTEEGQGHKHDAFQVVGVLAPTGTPNDRAVFVNIEGFFLLDGHAKPAARPEEPSSAAAHDPHEHDEHPHDEHAADEAHPEPSGTAGQEAPGEAAHEEHTHEDSAHDEHEPGEHPHPPEAGPDKHEPHAHDEPDPEPAEHEHGEHGHDEHEHGEHEHAHEPLPEAQREVTAILVRSASPILSPGLHQAINEGNVAQAVYPIREVASLFEGIVGNVEILLLALAAMVVVVSALGMMVSLYNSMSDRRREIGIMRALGARRSTVLWVILIESVLLSLGGGLWGLVLGHGGVALLSPWVEGQTGVTLSFLQFEPLELPLILLLVLLAALVGLLPAISGYRTDVSQALSTAP